jgi:hypothetical protein
MKRLFLILSLLSISGLAMSQSENTRRWVEVDVSMSPYAKPILFEGRAMSAEVAVRYRFSDRFSAGLGVAPSTFYYDYQNGNADRFAYVPFYVSLRYQFDEGAKFSPYVIGNLGMSFLQLADYAYQPRLGLGMSTWITPKTRLFAELSLAFFDDIYTLYAPLSIGFRF